MAVINRDREAKLSRDKVASALHYDPDTGEFTRVSGPKRGKKAGYFNQKGRKRILIFGQVFLASRLAWLLYHGTWPEETVDHINGDPSDDRIVNLRLASESEQQWNKSVNRNNASSVKGVSFNKRRAEAGLPPWEAYITIFYKRDHLGYFASLDEATQARQEAEMAYHGSYTREVAV